MRWASFREYVIVESCEGCDFFCFFQAEDGIRAVAVTGVQTCALPISRPSRQASCRSASAGAMGRTSGARASMMTTLSFAATRCALGREVADAAWSAAGAVAGSRSEERRVGKEGRSRWSPDHLKKKEET